MKKVLVAGLLIISIIFSFAACDSSKSTNATKKETYESIYEEYSKKIKEATPILIEEYNTEAAGKAGDISALAELSNDKISELAKINVDGTEKMAELMLKNGDTYEDYSDWASKLYDVYQEQALLITEAYLDSAK